MNNSIIEIKRHIKQRFPKADLRTKLEGEFSSIAPESVKRFLKMWSFGSRDRAREEYFLKKDTLGDWKETVKFLFGKPRCRECGEALILKAFSLREPKRFCSSICSNSNQETKDRKEKSYIKHYGVSNPSRALEVKEKKIETCLKNRGTQYPSQCKAVNSKIRERSLEKYGVSWPTAASSFVKKVKSSNLRKYGVINVMQHPEIFKKNKSSAYSRTPLKIRGRVFKYLQGYEGAAVKFLIDFLAFRIEHLESGVEMGVRIPLPNGKIYYPDLKYKNLLIEVKSTYTAGMQGGDSGKEMLKNLVYKMRACKRAGYSPRVMIRTGEKWLLIKSIKNLKPKKLQKSSKELQSSDDNFLVLN